MPLADVVGDGVPGAVFEFFEVAFVFGVEDDGAVGGLEDDVGDEGALGAGVGGLPAEGDDGLAAAAGADGAAEVAGEAVGDVFEPGLEEGLHRERPGEALEFAEAGESAFVEGPLDGAEGLPVVVAAEGDLHPAVDLAVGGAGGWDVADLAEEAFAEAQQALDEGAGVALGLEGAAVFVQREVDGGEEVAVVPEIGELAGDVERAAVWDSLRGVGLPVDAAAGVAAVAFDHLEVAVDVAEEGADVGEDDAGEDPGWDLAVGLGELGEFEDVGGDAPAGAGEGGADAEPAEPRFDDETVKRATVVLRDRLPAFYLSSKHAIVERKSPKEVRGVDARRRSIMQSVGFDQELTVASCLIIALLVGCGTDATNRTDSDVSFEVDEPEPNVDPEPESQPKKTVEAQGNERDEPFPTYPDITGPCESEVCYYTFEDSLATVDEWRHFDPDDDEQFAYEITVRPRADRDDRLGEFGDKLQAFKDGDTAFFGLGGPFSPHGKRLFECGPGQLAQLEQQLDAPGHEPRYSWRFEDVLVRCEWPYLSISIDRDSGAAVRKRPARKHTTHHPDRRDHVHVFNFPEDPPIAPRYLRWYRRTMDALFTRRFGREPDNGRSELSTPISYYLTATPDAELDISVTRWAYHESSTKFVELRTESGDELTITNISQRVYLRHEPFK